MKFSCFKWEPAIKIVPNNIDVRINGSKLHLYSGLDVNIQQLIKNNTLIDKVELKYFNFEFKNLKSFQYNKFKYEGYWNKISDNEYKFNTIVKGVYDRIDYIFPGLKFEYKSIEDNLSELSIYTNNKVIVNIIKQLK